MPENKLQETSKPGLPTNPTASQLATYGRQERFLIAYAGCGRIYQAAATAECSPRSFEKWNDADVFGFQKRYQAAQHRFLEKLETEADRRAVDGVDKPIVHLGRVTGTYKVYSDNLLMFRMKKLDPNYRENYNVVLDERDVKGLLDAMREAGTPRVVDGTSHIVDQSPASPTDEAQDT